MTKSRLIIFPICWIFIIFISCTENKAYNHVLSSADSMMNLNDESAKIAIQMLDSMKPKWGELSKSQKMRCQLLYHKAMNKADIMFTSDSVMKDVVAYYDKYGSANERMLANYVLGCVYRDLHEAPLALEYYNKATDKLIPLLQIVTMARFTGYIAKWDLFLANNTYLIKYSTLLARPRSMLILQKTH